MVLASGVAWRLNSTPDSSAGWAATGRLWPADRSPGRARFAASALLRLLKAIRAACVKVRSHPLSALPRLGSRAFLIGRLCYRALSRRAAPRTRPIWFWGGQSRLVELQGRRTCDPPRRVSRPRYCALRFRGGLRSSLRPARRAGMALCCFGRTLARGSPGLRSPGSLSVDRLMGRSSTVLPVCSLFLLGSVSVSGVGAFGATGLPAILYRSLRSK